MEQTNVLPTGVRIIRESGIITLDRLYANTFQKEGTLTAQLRQIVKVKSYYPTKKTASDMQEGLFTTAEFGFAEQEFVNVENRVAFLLVPANATEAMIQAKLDAANAKKACIYRVLSTEPILDENQRYAVDNHLNDMTLDRVANSQVMRYPAGHEQEQQLILWKGVPQYRRTFFWNSPMADQDARSADPAKQYVSPEIQEELLGLSVGAAAFQGQTL